MDIQDGHVFLVGEGHTEDGQFPFVDKMNLGTFEKERLYQSSYTDKAEKIFFPTKLAEGKFVVRIESPTDYPNYYIRNIFEEKSVKNESCNSLQLEAF